MKNNILLNMILNKLNDAHAPLPTIPEEKQGSVGVSAISI